MRRLFAVTLLVVAACGKSPSSPSEPPASPPSGTITFADFSGLWTAQYTITACEWDRHCVLYMGTKRDFNLRLVQSGTHVRGLFVQGVSVAAIEGDVASDGTLTMNGSTPPASPRDGSFTIPALTLRLGAGSALQGTFTAEDRAAPQNMDLGFGMKVTGGIVAATWRNLSELSNGVEGSYFGRFVVRSCTPLSNYCYPNERDDVVTVSLAVTRVGAGVSAIYQQGGTRVALQGTMSGSTIDLAGESGTSDGQGLDRITNWRGTVDAFGRMSGSFHFDMLWPAGAPTLGGSADCELVQLVKVAS